MKCKICGQEAGWFYPIFSLTGRCVHCKLYIERELNPTDVDEEWRKYSEKSEKACDKYLKTRQSTQR